MSHVQVLVPPNFSHSTGIVLCKIFFFYNQHFPPWISWLILGTSKKDKKKTLCFLTMQSCVTISSYSLTEPPGLCQTKKFSLKWEHLWGGFLIPPLLMVTRPTDSSEPLWVLVLPAYSKSNLDFNLCTGKNTQCVKNWNEEPNILLRNSKQQNTKK